MRKLFAIGMAVLLTGGGGASVDARDQGRKLPLSAYLKSAKIHVISGDISRYPDAVAMLDSLSMHYGPHAEALSLTAQIYIDYLEREPNPSDKVPHLQKMVAYWDSLAACCANNKLKKDHRQGCSEYTEQADSTKVKYWREFYNAGLGQLTEMERLKEQLAGAADSAETAFYEASMQANFDSSLANMQLAMMIDDTDYRTYVGVGAAYEHMNDLKSAIEWKQKGLAVCPDSAQLLFSIAYNYVSLDNYGEAIPWLRGYLNFAPNDTANWYNLSVCYNNSKMFDSAANVYRHMLTLDSTNGDALSGMGRFFNEMGRTATDSATFYQTVGDNAKAAEWQAHKDQAFDSSRVYFQRAFSSNPNDEFVAEMYAIVHAIGGQFDKAAAGFAQLTTLQPTNPAHWTSLGDCYLNLKDWDKAVDAYEKVVELEPDNVEMWEQLRDIYHEQGNAAGEAEANKKIKSLKG